MTTMPAHPMIREDGAWVLSGPPPSPSWVTVRPGEDGLVGRRAAWLDVGEVCWRLDYRVVANPVQHADGSWGVTLVDEVEWWSSRLAGRAPAGLEHIQVEAVWLEAPGCGTPA